eukprot:scaffold60611_cov46-Phaeocystis_antarctica.AAC.2
MSHFLLGHLQPPSQVCGGACPRRTFRPGWLPRPLPRLRRLTQPTRRLTQEDVHLPLLPGQPRQLGLRGRWAVGAAKVTQYPLVVGDELVGGLMLCPLPAHLRQHVAHRRARRRAQVSLAPLVTRHMPHFLLGHLQPPSQVCGGACPRHARSGRWLPRPLGRLLQPTRRLTQEDVHLPLLPGQPRQLGLRG